MKIFSKNQSGFSLVEIMIATAMLAGLSLGVMKTLEMMNKGQVVSDTKLEEFELKRLVATNLLDKNACNATLGGRSIGSNITEIKNSGGAVLYTSGLTYNNSIEITQMTIVDKGLPGANGSRSVDLVISAKRVKKILKETAKDIKIPLIVTVPMPSSATGVIISCFTNENALIDLASEKACIDLGGAWNPLAVTRCSPLPYVSKAGDTMSGNLVSSATITASDFCTAGNCKTMAQLALSNQSCSNGFVQNGVQANGTPRCLALQCGANLFFAGLDAGGSAVCRPYPTQTCPTNQYVSSVNPNGTVNCVVLPNNAISNCAPGQVVQSINAGIPTCVSNTVPASCGVGQVVQSIDSAGIPVCVSNTIAASCGTGQVVQSINAAGVVTCVAASNKNPQCRTIYAGNGGRVAHSVNDATAWSSASCNANELATAGGSICSAGVSVYSYPPSYNTWRIGCYANKVVGKPASVSSQIWVTCCKDVL